MKWVIKRIAGCLGVALLLGSGINAHAFALLGPYESWMETTNYLRQPDSYYLLSDFSAPGPTDFGYLATVPEDIGGPMDIGSGYRWNVPVVTYGFDPSFLAYFGTNGVAAVKSAFQVFNDLPPASSLIVSNFLPQTVFPNYTALADVFYDLKSQAMLLMMEQLGLAKATRYVFVIKQWDPSLIDPNAPYGWTLQTWWGSWAIPEFIVQRNFDPETYEPTAYVNNVFYTALIEQDGGTNVMVPFTSNPNDVNYAPLADSYQQPGYFFKGLTRDDAGGLRYLLSPDIVNYENLLSDVRGAGRKGGPFVDGAWRPGVDKIRFMEQPKDSNTGEYQPYVYLYTDSYYLKNPAGVLGRRPNPMKQELVRVVSKPDILFCVGNIGTPGFPPQVDCTGTTNWINNAVMNGNSSGAGPGVIQPGIVITFCEDGFIESPAYPASPTPQPWSWASFDGSTNAPITYPVSQP